MAHNMIFIDSNIFISYYNLDDQNHESALKIIKDIESNKYGDAFISDYVFNEVMTVSLIKIKDKEKVVKLGYYILRSNQMLKVNKEIFRKSWKLFQESNLKMSFTDFTNLAILDLFKIENIATLDKEFKQIKDIKVIDN